MKTVLGALLLFCLNNPAFASDTPIGFRTSTLTDTQNERPLELVVWYPSVSTAAPQLIADTPVFVGALAIPDAPPAAGAHPLVVLSHGFRGNWGNQSWLATALVRQGYIVAAVNHPGTTTRDRNPAAAARLWQRPVDLQRAIDAVMAQPEHFGSVAKRQIAVIGHSLGGWTALEIAGARFAPERFAQDCSSHPQLSSCSTYAQLNPDSDPASKARLLGDLSDSRVTAIVSLDLGLSRGLTDKSLATLPVPTLVIAAGAPSEDLPAQLESADLARRLPPSTSRYVEIKDASHFSFLSMCKPGAIALLEEDAPGDGVICRDGDNARPRATIQLQIASLINAFLTQSFATEKG
ncbi:alpha/beta hydrolase family protein [Pseudomonas vancouverensis]|uniref:Alpha/beta fold hydrolase n=1 Tax=Pseudomonas vancouverensis TaxID=95300 RepID=A0A1H2NNY6_PSEVA|nr:alpha/beta fold hydrolase [Pseudomonas vancouverensis]KAB0495392.1 alpha/beta fold hydrolase [Pseudomonas vancouverensis]TDB62471.1 alpha/beta fold hydrolase [Pseudomonas vancouverensis]SDV07217.1 Predicted dienelactone hydrolase [Pseudomonas vancouverensis]